MIQVEATEVIGGSTEARIAFQVDGVDSYDLNWYDVNWVEVRVIDAE